MEFDLPFPPSTNTYWRNVRGKVLISAKGRAYKNEVYARVLEQHGIFKPLTGPLKATVELHLPDKRKRDIDNYFKALFDALAHASVFLDDSQIMELYAIKVPKTGGEKGKTCVIFEQL